MLDFLLSFTSTELSVFFVVFIFVFAGLSAFGLADNEALPGLLGLGSLFFLMAFGTEGTDKAINDYLTSKNSTLKIRQLKLYKVDKKEFTLSNDVVMKKNQEVLVGNLSCGSLILRDCLDLVVKNQDLITEKGDKDIDVVSFE